MRSGVDVIVQGALRDGRWYGRPDVLESTAVDKPVVGDDHVLVRVHAAAVHPGDPLLRKETKWGRSKS